MRTLKAPPLDVVPYSWLHMNDNVMDPFHVQVLHSTFSGIQFHKSFALMPKVDFFYADHGVCYSAIRQLEGLSERLPTTEFGDMVFNPIAGIC